VSRDPMPRRVATHVAPTKCFDAVVPQAMCDENGRARRAGSSPPSMKRPAAGFDGLLPPMADPFAGFACVRDDHQGRCRGRCAGGCFVRRPV